jgi:RNA polymerase sigma factor for flagellar operon FliA
MSVALSAPSYGKKTAAAKEPPWLAAVRRLFFTQGNRSPDPGWWGMEAAQPRNVAKLVEHYAPLVKRMAVQFAARVPASIPLEDLVQCGMMGLIEAIQRYEIQDEAQFETYAVARVRGAMLDLLRANDWVPRSVRQAMRDVESAIERLSHELGRPPTDQEIADALNWPLARYHEVLSAAQGHAMLYLDDLIRGDIGELPADDYLERHLGDERWEPAALAEAAELKAKVAQAITQLPEREQLVLSLYYEHELNLKEIGAVLEVSESRASQLLSSAIAHLRASLLGRGDIASKRRPKRTAGISARR